MSENKNYTPQRSDIRKKKRLNLILNGSIGVVALLIIFISATMFLGGDSDEAAVSNDSNQDNQSDINISTEDGEEDNNSNIDGEVAINDNNDNNSENETNEENDTNDNSNDLDGINVDSNNNEEAEEEEGEWRPVGTDQEELSLVFDSGHVNRDEMEKALQYATGISESDMTVWRIENGGGGDTAVGFVSTYDDRHTPYKVTISWVENEGWKPVSVEEQSSNPYISG